MPYWSKKSSVGSANAGIHHQRSYSKYIYIYIGASDQIEGKGFIEDTHARYTVTSLSEYFMVIPRTLRQ